MYEKNQPPISEVTRRSLLEGRIRTTEAMLSSKWAETKMTPERRTELTAKLAQYRNELTALDSVVITNT